jgi:hypothetical protein
LAYFPVWLTSRAKLGVIKRSDAGITPETSIGPHSRLPRIFPEESLAEKAATIDDFSSAMEDIDKITRVPVTSKEGGDEIYMPLKRLDTFTVVMNNPVLGSM